MITTMMIMCVSGDRFVLFEEKFTSAPSNVDTRNYGGTENPISRHQNFLVSSFLEISIDIYTLPLC